MAISSEEGSTGAGCSRGPICPASAGLTGARGLNIFDPLFQRFAIAFSPPIPIPSLLPTHPGEPHETAHPASPCSSSSLILLGSVLRAAVRAGAGRCRGHDHPNLHG